MIIIFSTKIIAFFSSISSYLIKKNFNKSSLFIFLVINYKILFGSFFIKLSKFQAYVFQIVKSINLIIF